MKLRPLMLAAVLAASIIGALLAKGGARWNRAEAWFLDFLVANVRDRFEKENIMPSENVVFIGFDEKDKTEFSAWPPGPIDYIMALRKLKIHEPVAVAFSDVLLWEPGGQQFIEELQQTLIGFSQVALAFSATTGATAESGLVSDDKEVPSIPMVGGDSSAAPALSRLVFPDARLSTQMQLGFVATDVDKAAEVPPLLVARADTKLVPSLAAQLIALQSHAPYISQRLRFGVGAGLYLGEQRFVPLARDGTARPRLSGEMSRVNGLDLLTPELGDAAAQLISDKLGKNKLIILGTSPSAGETHAKLAAWALALPKLSLAPEYATWLATLIAVLVTVWQLRLGRWGSVAFGVCAVATLLGIALAIFQTSLTWWSPLLPGAVLLAGTIFCAAWPRRE